MNTCCKKIELLAPAGNLEKLKVAVHYGADAVYVGAKHFSLRNFSQNFDLEDLEKAVEFARSRHVKLYLACNIFPRTHELAKLADLLTAVGRINPHALIVSDPGVIALALKHAPQIPLHLSTQANTVNLESVRFWRNCGIERINLARELSLAEISHIAKEGELPVEVFVHGAMCISYSGRCLLSNYLTGRESNRGMCTQPCRWQYFVVEETRPGQYFPIAEDERGTYIFNSRDLCMIDHIPELIRSGVVSLKIEGRMKGLHYIGTVVKTYREAIDSWYENPEGFYVRPEWQAELENINNRGFCKGFYFNSNEDVTPNYAMDAKPSDQHFLGVVINRLDDGKAVLDVRNRIKRYEPIEIVVSKGPPISDEFLVMTDLNGNDITIAQPNDRILVKAAHELNCHDFIRREKKLKTGP